MLDTEIMNWGCDFADGFKISENGKTIYCPDGPYNLEKLLKEHTFDYLPKWNLVYYPLFLQRVIEGINRAFDNDTIRYSIIMDGTVIQVYDLENTCITEEYNDEPIDQAKEEAVKYVFTRRREE